MNTDFKDERWISIQRYIEANNGAKVTDLARELNVSEMTIRRDLNELYKRGSLQRTHGGALPMGLPHKAFQPNMFDRLTEHLEEKQRIASAVVKMIGPRESIFLSSGTTSYWVAKALIERDDLTVIVNSLVNAYILAQSQRMEVMVVGGFLRRGEMSLMGHLVEETVKDMRVDKVIMGIRGIHPEYGLTSDNLQELRNDRAMIGMSSNVIVVADHTKFGYIAASRTAPVTAAKMIVTSDETPMDMVDSIRKKGVPVIQV